MSIQIEKKSEIDQYTRHFVNDIASKLNPSNDTMEAVRLFRAELPKLLTHQKKMIREEITNLGSKNFDRQNVLSLPSLNIKEDE